MRNLRSAANDVYGWVLSSQFPQPGGEGRLFIIPWRDCYFGYKIWFEIIIMHSFTFSKAMGAWAVRLQIMGGDMEMSQVEKIAVVDIILLTSCWFCLRMAYFSDPESYLAGFSLVFNRGKSIWIKICQPMKLAKNISQLWCHTFRIWVSLAIFHIYSIIWGATKVSLYFIN